MTYVVTDECIKCKHTTCVDVCPVDCFYEGELMLVINPEECIDCGVCVPECPPNAIKPDDKGEDLIIWIERATKFSKVWPNITKSKQPLENADKYDGEANKYEKYMND